jgi:hypothetical protein
MRELPAFDRQSSKKALICFERSAIRGLGISKLTLSIKTINTRTLF